MSETEDFASLLKSYREELRLSQRSLAEQIYINHSLISRYERGKLVPRLKTLDSIIGIFADKGLSVDKREKLRRAAGQINNTSLDANSNDRFVKDILAALSNVSEELRSSYLEVVELLAQTLRSMSRLQKARANYDWVGGEQAYNDAAKQYEGIFAILAVIRNKEKGTVQYHLGEYEQAVNSYAIACGYARAGQDLHTFASLLVKQADAARRLGGDNWGKSRRLYDEAREIFERSGELEETGNCLRKISATYGFEGRPDFAEEYIQESFDIARKFPEHPCYYKALAHRAWFAMMRGEWVDARKLAEEVVELTRDLGHAERAKYLLYAGDAYRLERLVAEAPAGFLIERRFKDAEHYYQEGIRTVEQEKARDSSIDLIRDQLYRRLGMVYLKQPARRTDARIYLRTALADTMSLKDRYGVAEAQREIGDLYLADDRPLDAEVHLLQSEREWQNLRNQYQQAITISSLCQLYYIEERYEEVAELHSRIDGFEGKFLNYPRAKITLLAGKSLIKMQEYDRGFGFICQASEVALAFNSETFIETHLGVLDQVTSLEQQKNRNAAMRLCEAYVQYWKQRATDSGHQDVIDKSVHFTELKYDGLRSLNTF